MRLYGENDFNYYFNCRGRVSKFRTPTILASVNLNSPSRYIFGQNLLDLRISKRDGETDGMFGH